MLPSLDAEARKTRAKSFDAMVKDTWYWSPAIIPGIAKSGSTRRKAMLSPSSPIWMPAVVESMSNLSPRVLVEVPVPLRSLVVGSHAKAAGLEEKRNTRRIRISFCF